MSLLQDAKLEFLRTATGAEGHVNDLEAAYLIGLGATAADIIGMWGEVFDLAAIPAGQHNDRAMLWLASQGAVGDQYNERWLSFWQGGGAPPGPQPPLMANVRHWFDMTDQATVFSDLGCSVPAIDGDKVGCVLNKGLEPNDLIENPVGSVPQYKLGNINSLATFHNPVPAPNIVGTMSLAGAAAGASAFLVGRVNDLVLNQPGVRWITEERIDANVIGSGNWEVDSNGAPVDTLKPVVQFEWVWAYYTIDAAGNLDTQVSGGPLVSAASTYTAPGASSTMLVGGLPGDTAEVIIYDRKLTPAEVATVIAFFDTKYGVLPFLGPPPTVVSLMHHYDFTDNAQVFRNLSGTQLARDGDTIRLIKDKGFNATDLTTPNGTDSPTYRKDYVSGENVADFSPGINSKPMTGTDGPGHVGTLGMTNAIIFRLETALGPAVPLVNWGPGPGQLRGFREFGAGVMAWDYPGPLGASSLAVIVPGEWYLWYASFTGVFAGADDRARLSGEVSQSIAGLGPDTILPGEPISLQHVTAQDFQIAEWAVWDGPLTDPELAALTAYADAKYGTLPHPGNQLPAPGNLLHHVDPTDAATVWADASATIPATNGVTVERIDNKGVRGTPLLRQGSGTPIYRTGVLNGENVIDFSNANLAAIAESPGLTISTTGYTLAMVTRRRASHIGDSILWRWTPFAGTPGPSLRGRFALNGNFHRTDPLADEDLVADPSTVDTWYLLYFSNDAAGAVDDAKFGSPGPEVAGPFGVATDIPDLADVRFGTSSTLVEHAEAWFWDRPLTLAERAQLVAYADAKYGTLPHL